MRIPTRRMKTERNKKGRNLIDDDEASPCGYESGQDMQDVGVAATATIEDDPDEYDDCVAWDF